ncbi:MAG: ABC transporter ATP-binding protein [Tissierellia bacterium]|nr:ABC transporter ATP-binding protein [Tissierellia bacterium]
MKETILSINNLTLNYIKDGRHVKVYDDFSLNIERGKTVTLLGESGSGKSTLAKVVTGLLPPSAKILSGNMKLLDQNIAITSKFLHWNKIRGSKIAMIFQDAIQSLNPVSTIYKHFEELLLFHKICQKSEVRIRASQLLKELRIEDTDRVLDAYPFELSGGMCQRVCIAMCLSLEPEILIADEPTSALDVFSAKKVIEALESLKGVSVLLITHDISVAKRASDYIYVIEKGRICENGTVLEILQNPKQAYTKSLVNSYRQLEEIKVPWQENKNKILQIKNVTKSYDGKKNIIDDLSFDIYEGEVFGIIGESGCGKSTLARSIIGLEQIKTGEIIYKNQNLLKMNSKKRRAYSKEIQMIFQDSRAVLNPRATVLELVCEPLNYNKIANHEEKIKMAKEILNRVGITKDLHKAKPPALSTGQCQRVSIARALVMKPKILICDEAVSALDVNIQLQILKLIAKLKTEFNLTILMITHDLRIVKNFCSRVATMKAGKFDILNCTNENN